MFPIRSRSDSSVSSFSGGTVLKHAPYMLDAEGYEFFSPGGRSFQATRLEYRVLAALMSAHGRPVSSDRLMDKLYSGTDDRPDVSTLRVVISKIRGKMRDAGMGNPLVNQPNIGYSITGDPGGELEVLLLDRGRLNALDAVLTLASVLMPDAVALLRSTS
jgi:DNA-binding response OmpR family regulator